MTAEHRSLKLTNARSVNALKPRVVRYIVRDAQVRGLELRVETDGRKVWTVRYRNAAKEQRRMNLGEYHPERLTLAAARKRANVELGKVDAGTDPQAEREAARRAAEEARCAEERAKADSIEALCTNYIERHAKVKKRTWRDDQIKINGEILPKWKRRPVSAITRRDCRELIQGIADRSAPILANRTAALLSRLFRFAVDEEIITANPAAHLPKPGVEAQARPDGEREAKPYEPEEIRAIWENTENLDPAPRAIYRLGLITGQRPGEIGNMEWAELDGQWWTIPGRRTKNGREHRVYLTQLALDALSGIEKYEGDDHVFAGHRGKRQLAEINAKVFAGIRPRLKPRHAMRDTVASGLAACGVAVEDISRVLNHASGSRVTAGYVAHRFDKEKRLALGKWARKLTAILEQKDNKVVEFSAKGA